MQKYFQAARPRILGRCVISSHGKICSPGSEGLKKATRSTLHDRLQTDRNERLIGEVAQAVQ
jgi:hypothetical protein